MCGTGGRLEARVAASLAVTLVSAALLQPSMVPAQPGSGQPPEAKTVHLKGRVLGPDGQPAPGAEVGVSYNGRPVAPLESIFTGKCSEAGEFGLAAEGLDWQPFCCVFARQGTDLMGATVVAKDDEGKRVEVRLQAAGYIHTSVVSPEGEPLPGMGTFIRAGSQWAALLQGPATNERGELQVGPLPAGLRLGLSVVSELQHLVPRDVWREQDITPQPGETYELAPLTLDCDGRSVEGVLEDAEGKPLPGAQVACYLPQWPVNSATADEQGRFKLTQLPVEGYDVWLIAADVARQLYVMSLVDPDTGEKVRLVLRPLTDAGGLLSGPDGQVLADIPVRVFPTLKARWGGVTAYTTWNTGWVPLPQPVKTAEDGSWQVSGLIVGGMYAVQPEVPEARLDFEAGLFEVDRDGKPTDCGLMMVQ